MYVTVYIFPKMWPRLEHVGTIQRGKWIHVTTRAVDTYGAICQWIAMMMMVVVMIHISLCYVRPLNVYRTVRRQPR